MGSEQFSLCWNNFHTNLSTGFHSLFQGEHLVDVTLAAEGKILKAHKMVLSVCSPYFNELFRGNPCKHPIVFLKDVSASALDQLLTYMYRGEVSVRQDELSAFIKTAEALQIKGLTGQSNDQPSATNESLLDSHVNGSSAYLETLKNLPRDSQYMPSKKRLRTKHSLNSSSPLNKIKLQTPETSHSLQPDVFSTNHPCTSRTNVNSIDSVAEGGLDTVIPTKRSAASSLTSSDREDHGGLPVETQFLEPVTPKQEPMDEMDDYNDTSQYSDGTTLDDSMDASALLETKVSIGGDLNLEQSSSSSTATNWPTPKLKLLQMGEVPAPGCSEIPLQFIQSKRGNPQLVIYNHVFNCHIKYDGGAMLSALWQCKQKRSTKCRVSATTRAGKLCWVKGFHNHPPDFDAEPQNLMSFKEEEHINKSIQDFEDGAMSSVVIFSRVVVHSKELPTGIANQPLRFMTSARGLPVLVYAGHMYTLEERKNNKTTWVCVKRRKLNCQGCVTTTTPPPNITNVPSAESLSPGGSSAYSLLAGLYKFTLSRKGMYHLIFGDYIFRPNGRINTQGPSYWECTQNRKTGCRARCQTGCSGELIVRCTVHNHDSFRDLIQKRESLGEIVCMPLNSINGIK